MTQKNILIAAAVVVIIALSAWYLSPYSPNALPSSSAASSNTTSTKTQTGTKTSQGTTTQGGNYTCSINTIADSGKTTETIYATNTKTRLDFRIEAPDGTMVNTHTIHSGSVSYTWVDGQPTGTKKTIIPSSTIMPQPSGGVITTTTTGQVASDCHPWSPDLSQFVPPSGITFVAQ